MATPTGQLLKKALSIASFFTARGDNFLGTTLLANKGNRLHLYSTDRYSAVEVSLSSPSVPGDWSWKLNETDSRRLRDLILARSQVTLHREEDELVFTDSYGIELRFSRQTEGRFPSLTNIFRPLARADFDEVPGLDVYGTPLMTKLVQAAKYASAGKILFARQKSEGRAAPSGFKLHQAAEEDGFVKVQGVIMPMTFDLDKIGLEWEHDFRETADTLETVKR